MVVHQPLLSQSPFLHKSVAHKGAGRALVVGIAAGLEFVEVEGTKSEIAQQPDGFRGIALAPEVFFAYEQPHFAKAVYPVDGPQLDVADVAVVFAQTDTKKEVLLAAVELRDVALQPCLRPRLVAGLKVAANFGVVEPGEVGAAGVGGLQAAEVEAGAGYESVLHAVVAAAALRQLQQNKYFFAAFAAKKGGLFLRPEPQNNTFRFCGPSRKNNTFHFFGARHKIWK